MFRFVLFLTALTLLGCGNEIPWRQTAATVDVTSRVVRTRTLDDLGRFSRVVALENHQDALLGNIEIVKLDPTNGDILAADLKATKGLYRFDADGRFKHQLGSPGQGPGQYETLVDFAVTDDGGVVLLTTFKLIAFRRDGSLRKEVRMGLTGFRIVAWQEGFIVYGMKAPPNTDWVLWPFDRDLRPGSAFQSPDPRLAKLIFLPRDLMAVDAHRLYVGEPYQFGLTVYHKNGQAPVRYRFASENHKLDGVWQHYNESEAHQRKIGQGVHRIEHMHAFNGQLHFVEIGGGGRIYRVNLLDPEQHQLTRFEGARPMLASQAQGGLSFDAVAGRFDKGIIGVLYDPGKWAQHRHNYPQLADIEFRDSDNPLILFFEYHPRTNVAKNQAGGVH